MSEQRRAALAAAWDALRARRPHLPAGDSFDQGFAEACDKYHEIMMGTTETGARLNSFVYELYLRFPDALEGEGEPEARILAALDKRMTMLQDRDHLAPGQLVACPMCGVVFLRGGKCPVCALREESLPL